MTDLLVLGRIVVTTGALKACENVKMKPETFLDRHARGDRSELAGHTSGENLEGRVQSSCSLPTGETVWVVTEPDRLVTLVLLPEEF